MTTVHALVAALIKHHEVLRLTPSTETGHVTIGYGRNLEAGISVDEAEYLFERPFRMAWADAAAFSWFAGLTSARQAVIVSMLYQLGLGGFKKFARMQIALMAGDYDQAALQMTRSKWATQVGMRAGQRGWVLRRMMRTGEWPVEGLGPDPPPT